jgi:hypothetical protein
VAALLLLAALPATAQPVPEEPPSSGVGWKGGGGPGTTSVRLGLGWTGYAFSDEIGHRVVQQGVALSARVRHRSSDRFGVDFNVTWGMTDWDRAKEWIDRGNQAGQWTTEHIRQVGDWATEDEKRSGARLLPAVFADMFLAMTYVAVPFCYVASVGGATTQLQVDGTAVVHTGTETVDVWGEAGVAALALPATRAEWDLGFGLVAGVGADVGPVRVGARVTWSPEATRTTNRAFGDVFIPSATISAGF